MSTYNIKRTSPSPPPPPPPSFRPFVAMWEVNHSFHPRPSITATWCSDFRKTVPSLWMDFLKRHIYISVLFHHFYISNEVICINLRIIGFPTKNRSIHSLKLTACRPLKTGGWETTCTFRGYVSFREGNVHWRDEVDSSFRHLQAMTLTTVMTVVGDTDHW